MAEETEVLDGGGEVDEALVSEAKELGWADKDSWKGKPEEWVDAKTFVEKGRQVMPLLRQNNKRLLGEVTNLKQQLDSQNSALRATTASIKALEDAHAEDVAEQVKAAKEDLILQLEEASRDGDHAGVAKLTAKLTELRGAEKDAGAAPVKQDEPAARLDPGYIAWVKENQEFADDPEKIALAGPVSFKLRAEGETSVGAAFLDKVRDRVEERLGGGKKRPGAGKVAGGNGGGGRSGGGGVDGKTYADLPPDAKAACDKMAAKLVGANRKHKDVASWRASYTKQFFEME